MEQRIKESILKGETILGIELGSTRIKAVLIDKNNTPIASGSHPWENRYENSIWTYNIDDVWLGIQDCYSRLIQDVWNKYGVAITTIGAIGFSAMMHGYLVFDKKGNQLVPFRTWRNTMTEQAAALLTEKFSFNIPQRWSIAHLYQAILNDEPQVNEISYMTTLSGYVHWKLTGEKVLGIGDASGMFPIDSNRNTYHEEMLQEFDKLILDKCYSWTLKDILPQVLTAGMPAGTLTSEGAKLLDISGKLMPGVILCPPEGDAGTGMVATNSVMECTGNVSAGTSIFAMAVLESPLSKVHKEIDMVTTASGKPVAMVHCNNCTSDLDAWIGLFHELTEALGGKTDITTLYDMFYNKALEGDADCGGLLAYNYYSGEPVTGLDEGRPLFVRTADSHLTLGNFARTILFSALGTLKLGMDILFEEEGVHLSRLLGHGGFFKTKGVGQKLMAAALKTPVSVMDTAGEGGPWGMALLAAYAAFGKHDETLEDYLNNKVFADRIGEQVEPDNCDVQEFTAFMERYSKGIAIERAAIKHLEN